MPTMPTKATIEVEIPDGWEFVRWDYAMEGEFYLGDPSSPTECIAQQTAYRHVIVRKAITYREPDARDVGKVIEVANKQNDEYEERFYVGKMRCGKYVCEVDDSSKSCCYEWNYARVKVSP